MKQPPQTIALVSCVMLKQEKSAPAEELYISPWFVKAKSYAKIISDRWFILSSRHGLLEPQTMIEPYDSTLYKTRKPERSAWAASVAKKLMASIPPKSRIIILAGQIYREALIPLLTPQFEVEVPLQGLGIGEQLSYLKRALEELES